MRILALTLALATTSCSAFAASPLAPLSHSGLHHAKTPYVVLELKNTSVQSRQLIIGDASYDLPMGRSLRIPMQVGSSVRVYSDQNTKVNGQVLLQAQLSDAGRTIAVR